MAGKFFDIEQNTPEWDQLRLGKFSASMIASLFMDKKTKGYRDQITRVAFECLCGRSQERYFNGWMRHGHEFEPEAAEAYVYTAFEQRGEIVELSNGGIWVLDEYTCASPDRAIVGLNGGVEIKCPSFQVYRDYFETGEIPKDYMLQMQMQMLVTGWDFVDYMPYVSRSVRQILCRVDRSEEIISDIKQRLDDAINEAQELIETIKPS